MTNLAPDPDALTGPAAPPLADPRCRNCNASAAGAFCPRCGQETAVALPTARQFLKDAAGRYVSLDGRLWRTLAALLLHPGYLTREYLTGRRRRYIRPARLFLVLSIAMFALFRVVVDLPMLIDAESAAEAESATAHARSADTELRGSGASITLDKDANLLVDGPPGPVTDLLKSRVDRFNAMPREVKVEQITFGVLRYGPYAMVALLPVFALLLKLLYLGRARRYPLRPRRYAEHLVFAAHDLSFLFLIVMIAVVVPWAPVRIALGLWIVIYSVWAMKAVYGGRWIGVIARASCLGVSYFVLFAVVVVGLLVTAVLLR